jgi:hypothetical protein
MKRWFYWALQAASLGVAFYSWIVEHSAGYENVLKFYAILLAFVYVVTMLVMKPGDLKIPPMSKPLTIAHALVDGGVVYAFAWMGSFGYAAVWLVGVFAWYMGVAISRKGTQSQTVSKGGVSIQAGRDIIIKGEV